MAMKDITLIYFYKYKIGMLVSTVRVVKHLDICVYTWETIGD